MTAGRRYDNIDDDKTRTWSFLPPWWRRQQRCEATVGFHCSSLDGRQPPGVWCYHGGDRMENNNNNMNHLEEVSVKALTVIVRPLHCPSHLSGQPFKDVFIWKQLVWLYDSFCFIVSLFFCICQVLPFHFYAYSLYICGSLIPVIQGVPKKMVHSDL